MTLIGKEIGELLVDNGLLTPEDLGVVEQEKLKTGESISKILARLGFASENQLKDTLELNYGVTFVSLAKLNPDPDLVRLVPEDVIRELQVVPISLTSSRLTLAMVNPDDSNALNEIRNYIQSDSIKSLVCIHDDFDSCVDQIFGAKAVTSHDTNGDQSAAILEPDLSFIDDTAPLSVRASGINTGENARVDSTPTIDAARIDALDEPDQVEEAVLDRPPPDLGELLLSKGIIDDDQLYDALKIGLKTKQSLAEVLISMELVTEEDLQFLLAEYFGSPLVESFETEESVSGIEIEDQYSAPLLKEDLPLVDDVEGLVLDDQPESLEDLVSEDQLGVSDELISEEELEFSDEMLSPEQLELLNKVMSQDEPLVADEVTLEAQSDLEEEVLPAELSGLLVDLVPEEPQEILNQAVVEEEPKIQAELVAEEEAEIFNQLVVEDELEIIEEIVPQAELANGDEEAVERQSAILDNAVAEEEPPIFDEPIVEEEPATIAEAVAEEKVPILDELVVEEELPVLDQVVVEEEPPTLDQVVVEEDPPAIDQVVAEEEPPILDQAAAEEDPPILDQVVAEEEPPILDQVVAEEDPPILDQVVAEEDPPILDQAAVEEVPPILDQAATEEDPPILDQVVIEEETPILEHAVAEEEPSISDEAVVEEPAELIAEEVYQPEYGEAVAVESEPLHDYSPELAVAEAKTLERLDELKELEHADINAKIETESADEEELIAKTEPPVVPKAIEKVEPAPLATALSSETSKQIAAARGNDSGSGDFKIVEEDNAKPLKIGTPAPIAASSSKPKLIKEDTSSFDINKSLQPGKGAHENKVDVTTVVDPDELEDDIDFLDLVKQAQYASISLLANHVTSTAIEQKCSDILVQGISDNVVVQYLKKGRVVSESRLVKQILPDLVACYKEMAGLDKTLTNKPQDRKVKLNVRDTDIELRVTTVPEDDGEIVAISIKYI